MEIINRKYVIVGIVLNTMITGDSTRRFSGRVKRHCMLLVEDTAETK